MHECNVYCVRTLHALQTVVMLLVLVSSFSLLMVALILSLNMFSVFQALRQGLLTGLSNSVGNTFTAFHMVRLP